MILSNNSSNNAPVNAITPAAVNASSNGGTTNNAPVNGITPAAANAPPTCPTCNKSVRKTSEVRALGKTWHNECFTCGATKGDGCHKKLTVHYHGHNNAPYCTSCYDKKQTPQNVTSSLSQPAVEAKSTSVQVAGGRKGQDTMIQSNIVDVRSECQAVETTLSPPNTRVAVDEAPEVSVCQDVILSY